VPVDNAELLDQWTELVVCQRETRVRLEAIRAMSECRVKRD
jgi:hypothetical protein